MLEQYIRHFDDTNELFKSRLAGFQNGTDDESIALFHIH
jgi:hypothetical protein